VSIQKQLFLQEKYGDEGVPVVFQLRNGFCFLTGTM